MVVLCVDSRSLKAARYGLFVKSALVGKHTRNVAFAFHLLLKSKWKSNLLLKSKRNVAFAF